MMKKFLLILLILLPCDIFVIGEFVVGIVDVFRNKLKVKETNYNQNSNVW
jgi:hypothetical protein